MQGIPPEHSLVSLDDRLSARSLVGAGLGLVRLPRRCLPACWISMATAVAVSHRLLSVHRVCVRVHRVCVVCVCVRVCTVEGLVFVSRFTCGDSLLSPHVAWVCVCSMVGCGPITSHQLLLPFIHTSPSYIQCHAYTLTYHTNPSISTSPQQKRTWHGRFNAKRRE